MSFLETRIGVLPAAFKLGSFQVDPSRREVAGKGRTVRISPRSLGVLLQLAKHPGQTVSHDDLIKQVWGEVVVGDEVLFKAISELRRIFGDTPSSGQVIKTIPKTGYQLQLKPRPHRPRARYRHVIAAAGTVALLFGLWFYFNLTGNAVNPEAKALLQKAQYLVDHGDQNSIPQAVEWLQQATGLEPDYAEAYGLMADIELHQLNDWKKARQSADTALRLNELTVSALLVRSQIALEREWDWSTSRQLLDRANQVEPKNPLALIGLAAWHASTGRHSEAIELARQAVALDPVNAILHGDLAFLYYLAGDVDSVLEAAESVLALKPGNQFALGMKLEALLYQRRISEARSLGNTLLKQHGVNESDLSALANTEDIAYRRHYLTILKRQFDPSRNQHQVLLAGISAQLTQTDEALTLLSEAVEHGTAYLPYLAVDPHFNMLRNNQRFNSLLREAGHPLVTHASHPHKNPDLKFK